jgi:hypothetical protein
MARRRKSVKRSPRRRSRKMGAISKSGLMDLAYQVAGGIAASAVSKAVKTALSSTQMAEKTQDLVANAVPVVAGFILPQKSPLMKGLATGMKIAGATKLIGGAAGLGRFGAIMNAGDETPFIAGIDSNTDYRSEIANNPMYSAY